MAFSDWYEVLDVQEAGGQRILNVYHVQRVNPAFDANNIADAFNDTILPSLRATQVSTLTHTETTARSLDDPLDFASLSISPNAGLKAGQGLSTFSSATIQFNRLRTDMKNGQKRFVAGDEVDIIVNTWQAAFLTLLDTLGTALVSIWEQDEAPGTPVCQFGILKRVCAVQPPPDPCPKYRLPENDAELEFYIPTTFLVRDVVRSQVSRKRLI